MIEPSGNRFTIEVLQESDGRWLADIPSVPGAMAYAKTEWEAIWKALEIRDDVAESRAEKL
jgi:predicted RNase H-like HicB family nuclease